MMRSEILPGSARSSISSMYATNQYLKSSIKCLNTRRLLMAKMFSAMGVTEPSVQFPLSIFSPGLETPYMFQEPILSSKSLSESNY